MTTTQSPDVKPLGKDGILSWLHFGDLHITTASEQNYRDFVAEIHDANAHLASSVDFAILPGDNADDGTEPQFGLVRQALDKLHLPVHILPGDHDIKSGHLDGFYRKLRAAALPHSFMAGDYHCIFLNSVDTGKKEGFGFGKEQLRWLGKELEQGSTKGKRPLLFMHTYPSELGASAGEVAELIRRYRVLFIDMGHTHYNEIANDGRTIYAATRSTGQIEEGAVGYSLAAIDNGVVSWKFKELSAGWPFVLITSPADHRFIIDPSSSRQVVRGDIDIRAKICGASESAIVTCQVDSAAPQPMSQTKETNLWRWKCDSTSLTDGLHRITVSVRNDSGQVSDDSVTVLLNQSGHYESPQRHSVDHENTIGRHEYKGILGTQLGPNKNGRKW